MKRGLSIALLAVLAASAGCGPSQDVAAARAAATTPTRRFDPCYVAGHARNLARAEEGNVRVLFIGDSITDEWRSRGTEVWKERLAPLGAANFGISADQTQHVLWRLESGELEGLAPEVVVLMIGTNNLKSGPTRMPPEAVAAGVEAILDLIEEKVPGAWVLLLSILPRQPSYPWIAATIRETNARLGEVEAEREGVRYLDLAVRFIRVDGTIDPELMAGDMLHLSEEGYHVWAEAMKPVLKEMLGEKAE